MDKLEKVQGLNLAKVSLTKLTEIYKGLKVKTIEAAIKSDQPRLFEITKVRDRKFTRAYLITLIIDMLSFLNLKTTMNEAQIKETADFIIDDFPNLNIGDLKMLFDSMKKGGMELYGSIDGSKIFQLFEKHWELRMSKAEQMNIQKHQDITDTRNNDDPWLLRKLNLENRFKP